jgi:hypothetical protein
MHRLDARIASAAKHPDEGRVGAMRRQDRRKNDNPEQAVAASP